jgi:hypothetical protein
LEVKALRALRIYGWTYEKLTGAFGISLGTAWSIVERKVWQHV